MEATCRLVVTVGTCMGSSLARLLLVATLGASTISCRCPCDINSFKSGLREYDIVAFKKSLPPVCPQSHCPPACRIKYDSLKPAQARLSVFTDQAPNIHGAHASYSHTKGHWVDSNKSCRLLGTQTILDSTIWKRQLWANLHFWIQKSGNAYIGQTYIYRFRNMEPAMLDKHTFLDLNFKQHADF